MSTVVDISVLRVNNESGPEGLCFSVQLAEEERLKEEAAQKELEEYLAMKEAFVVEESGTQEMENDEDVRYHLILFI